MSSRVLVALRIDAPPSRVFEAFTEEIGRWWRPNQLFVTARPHPGTLSMEAGVGGLTRVVVEHLGWDSIPPEHAARHGFPLGVFQQRLAEWWRDLLASLAADTR